MTPFYISQDRLKLTKLYKSPLLVGLNESNDLGSMIKQAAIKDIQRIK